MRQEAHEIQETPLVTDANSAQIDAVEHNALPTLLEPRVMLDATLEFDLGETSGTLNAMKDFAADFNTQAENIDAILEGYETQLTNAATVIDAVNGSSGSGASEDLTALIDAFGRVQVAIDQLQTVFSDNIVDLENGKFSVELKNVMSDDGATTLISFDPDDNSADNNTVDVSIALPEFGIDVDGLLADVLGDVALSSDLSIAGIAGNAITFSISSEFTAGTNGNSDVASLSISNFNFPNLFEVGGTVDFTDGEMAMNLGLLDLQVTSVTFASMHLAVNAESLGFGFEYSVSSGTLTNDLSSVVLPTIDTKIKDIDAADFVTLDANHTYKLVEVETKSSLEMEGVNYDFTTDLTVASKLSGNPLDTVSLDLDVTNIQDANNSGSSIDTALAETIATMVEALAVMGSDEVLTYLTDIGESLKSLLSSTLFDIDVPLTDLNIGEILVEMSDLLASLADELQIAEETVGFGAGNAEVSLFQSVTSYESGVITEELLNGLSDYKSITLAFLNADGTTARVPIELPALLSDSSKSVEERLAGLVSLLSTNLAAYGIVAAVAPAANGAKLTLSSNKSDGTASAIFALESATKNNGDIDEDFGFEDLGFSTEKMATITGALTEGGTSDDDPLVYLDTTENLMAFGSEQLTATTGGIDIDALNGITTIRYVLSIDGSERFVDVHNASGWNSVSALAQDLEKALEEMGVSVSVSATQIDVEVEIPDAGDDDPKTKTEQRTAFALTLDADEERTISLSVDSTQLVAAQSFEELKTWVVSKLNDKLEGVSLRLTTEGELIFDLTGLDYSKEFGSDTSASFDASDIGLEELNGLSLSADLTASIQAALEGSIGIDLVGLIGDMVSGDDSTALDANSSHGGDLAEILEENLFFDEIEFSVDVDATASSITGEADLGIVGIQVGSTDATKNFLHLNTQLDVELIGQDEDGIYSDRLTFDTVLKAISSSLDMVDGDVVHTEALGVSSLIGRLDLQGGIVTDGAGRGLGADGEGTENLSDVQIVDPDTLSDKELEEKALTQLLVQLGDVKVNVAGVSGLNENILNGIGFTVDNLLSLSDTAELALIAENDAALNSITALTQLDDADFLDTMVATANMLDIVGHALSEKLPFLDQEIPVLNFSVLDAVSFSADFLNALNELRNDPQSGLDVVDAELEKVFGKDTVELTWDGTKQTVLFDLTFMFLEDYWEQVGFEFDLVAIMGDALDDILGEELTGLVTSLTDLNGDGALVFDPLLAFTFSFGIDLSNTLKSSDKVATRDTKLGDLTSTSSVNLNPNGGNEFKITWTNEDEGTTKTLKFDADGYDTVGELVDALNTEAKGAFGDTVSVVFNETTGQIELRDTTATLTDDTGVLALFGSDPVESEEVDGTQTISLASDFTDYAGEHSFTLNINGEDIDISVSAEADRTKEEFVQALNIALAKATVERSALSSTAVTGITVASSQLLNFSVNDDGTIVLAATNFSEAAGYDPITFSVAAADISEAISFTISQFGGSNLATVLGLADDTALNGADATGDALIIDEGVGAPRIYLDTNKTGIEFSFSAGGEDLSLDLALGPVDVTVVGGKVVIDAGDGSGDDASLSLSIADIDGDEHVNQLDLSALSDLASSAEKAETGQKTYADLFVADIQIGLSIDLPFSDNLGLFNPDTDGFSWSTKLVAVKEGKDLKAFDSSKIDETFEGLFIDAYLSKDLDLSGLSFTLPDLAEFFENMNVFALLNDPVLVLEGLDMIFGQVQSLIETYLSGINLPIIGDALGDSATLFQQLRYHVIDEALEYASTPLEDGTMPTTVDLLTGFINDTLNDLFGTGDIEFMQAYLNTDGTTEESYVYGVLNFSQVLFKEHIDIDFDLGIPGLNLSVEEGSKILMQISYTLNVGFGYDKNGFFLLNDQDHDEVSLDFLVDAGTFEGSMTVLGILGLDAAAITLGSDGFIDETAAGTAKVTATLGADLFGDQGLTILDPTTKSDGADATTASSAYRDFSGVTATNGNNDVLQFESLIYVSQLSTSDLISFDFSAKFDIQINLEANIYDGTGEPIKISGVQIMPSVATDFIYKGVYSGTDGLTNEFLGFNNVRIDLTSFYDAYLAPVLDPINELISPVVAAFSFLDKMPFSLAVEALSRAYPIIGIAKTIYDVTKLIDETMDAMAASGGWLVVGSFDLLNSADDAREDGASELDMSSVSFSENLNADQSLFGVLGNPSSGFSLELNLISDPMNMLNLLLGNFDEVTIVTAKYTLFDVNANLNLSDELLDQMGMPGWAKGAISSAFKFNLSIDMEAAFAVEYRMQGLVSFVETLDPERLLDGIFIDADLITVDISLSAGLNAGIAGVNFDAYVNIDVDLNDPNNDGYVSFAELLAIFDAVTGTTDPLKMFGYLFEGDFSVGAKLRVWAGIDLWLVSLKWSFTVFDFNVNLNVGGLPVEAQLSNKVAAGETAILNVGSNASSSMTSITEDGSDNIVIDGPNSPIDVTYSSGGKTVEGTIDEHAGALIIPAGEGNNVVNLSAVSGGANTPSTITYTGSGRDTIMLPDDGVHVVFAGGGDDTITAGDKANGLYIIFGEAGSDTVEIPGGTVIYIGDDSYGMRDLFQREFATGGVTVEKILKFIGIDENGKPTNGAEANYDVGSQSYNLADLLTNYTAATQNLASNDADTVTLGDAGGLVLTGAGDDRITVAADGTGDITILSSAGDDSVTAGGTKVYIEGGAGSDTIKVSGDQAEVWGWGKQAGESGLTADNSNLGNLALADGADFLIGGTGNDALYGQLGNDILEGGMGNDTLSGGADDDLITGGTFKLTLGNANIEPTELDLTRTLPSALTIEVLDQADGEDTISGGLGEDILLGGGNSDTLTGNSSNDLLVGDFAKIVLSSSFHAQSLESTFMTSTNAGTDNLDGGTGHDILVAGAASAGETETLTDLHGNNILIGDFAEITGAKILDGATYISSIDAATGGVDNITAGRGHDYIIGGEGSDVISAGLGGDIVLGDNGTINISTSTISDTATDNDGNDTIKLGIDNAPADASTAPADLIDIVIAGTGDDEVTSETADLAVLGDTGSIQVSATALNALRTYEPPKAGASEEEKTADSATKAFIATVARTLTSTANLADGIDTITVKAGNTTGILGGGSDIADLTENGESTIRLLGDDGTITITPNKANDGALVSLVTAASLTTTNDDKITAGNGQHTIIGGLGADEITLGDGTKLLLGDSGSITYDTTTPADPTYDLVSESLNSTHANDTVTLSNGDVVAILGDGEDELTADTGTKKILGDSGTINWVHSTGGKLESTNPEIGGADTLNLGEGDNFIIGGAFGDTIDTHDGDGNTMLLGDTGSITDDSTAPADPKYDLESESLNSTLADDTVILGNGDVVAILGDGADTLTTGDGDRKILGDSGTINWVHTTGGKLDSSNPEIGGADTLNLGNGDNFIVGGAFGDTIDTRGGDGDTMLLGDTGSITYDTTDPADPTYDLVSETLANNPTEDMQANDTVTLGDGTVAAILGDGADKLTADTGNKKILGDSGTINWINSAGGKLESITPEIGGADTITLRHGYNLIVGGTDGDTIDTSSGNGNNKILGDSGKINLSATLDSVLETFSSAIGGRDIITAGAGHDLILAGFDNDTISAGAGDNTVLGDSGKIILFPGLDANSLKSVETVDPSIGGDDTITTLGGQDTIIGGAGSDLIYAGAGDDAILGDNGSYISATPTATGTFASQELAFGGNDQIYAEDGNDLIIGALGNDFINTGNGDDIALGDDGVLTFVNHSDLQTVALTNQSRGGDDEIAARDYKFGEDPLAAKEFTGDNIMFGQAGSDKMYGGSQDDFMIGDLATVSLFDYSTVYSGQSAADRISQLISIRTDIAGDETMYGGDGADTMIGGFGAEMMHGEGGDDIVIGDTIIYNRSYAAEGGIISGELTIETNYAYVTGGYDILYGEAGADIMIGGLGPDVFHGDTASDVLFSDGYAGIFKTTWSADGFADETPLWRLYTSNFAGTEATDLVSNAQQNDVIGSPLHMDSSHQPRDLIEKDRKLFGNMEDDVNLGQAHLFSQDLIALVSTESFMQNMAELLAAGVDVDVLRSAIEQTIREHLSDLWNLDLVALDRLINVMIDFLIENTKEESGLQKPDQPNTANRSSIGPKPTLAA